MNVMTVETPDPIVFRKATALLKKLNVKINVVEQDSKEAIGAMNRKADFEKACEGALTPDEFRCEMYKRVERFYDANGENIFHKKNSTK